MRCYHWLCTGAALVVVLACASWQARAAVISIDFGGEWIKVALVKVRRHRGSGYTVHKLKTAQFKL